MAARKNTSPGMNINTNSGVDSNLFQYDFFPQVLRCGFELAEHDQPEALYVLLVRCLQCVQICLESEPWSQLRCSSRREARPPRPDATRRSSTVTETCSRKSQYSSIPASSSTLRSCSSPHRPRVCGSLRAFTRLPVSVCSALCVFSNEPPGCQRSVGLAPTSPLSNLLVHSLQRLARSDPPDS